MATLQMPQDSVFRNVTTTSTSQTAHVKTVIQDVRQDVLRLMPTLDGIPVSRIMTIVIQPVTLVLAQMPKIA